MGIDRDGYLKDVRLHDEIIKHIEQDKYRLTKHAEQELKNDNLDLNDALHVLKTGRHNHGKTRFDNGTQTWRHAIQGKTKELKKEVRVIIVFVDEMLIITVMEL
jgi:hypothetical protein